MLKYKIDVLSELKAQGYNTNKLRKSQILAEGTIQSLRKKSPISWGSINLICALLKIQPGDLLEFVPDYKE